MHLVGACTDHGQEEQEDGKAGRFGDGSSDGGWFQSKGIRVDGGYPVEARLVVEVEAVERLLPVHVAQALTYLKLTGLPLALLVDLNVPVIEDGLRRLTLSRGWAFPSSRLPVL